MHRKAALGRLAAIACAAMATRAHALIYLPENTLESMLLRADAVVIATVADISPTANRGTLTVQESFKQPVPAQAAVTGVMLRVDTNVQKPRFAAGNRVVVFLGPMNETTGARAIIHAQVLASDAEVRAMKACILEIMPVAQVLADLADIKKEIAAEPLRAALMPLVGSKTAYTQILVGRLMSTRLAERVKPQGWEVMMMAAIGSPRRELALGGIAWATKFEALPAAVRGAVETAARQAENGDVKKAAEALRDRK